MKLVLLLALSLAVPASASDRILLVAANQAFDLGELAQAHSIFTYNGYEVDVATPLGGVARPKAYDDDAVVISNFLRADGELLARTLRIGEVDTSKYVAMFIVGGSGAMFEFPSNVALQKQIASMADRGAAVAAVCHGPAAFKNVVLANGRPLIEGKRVSGFTDEEEARFGGETARKYPFFIEQAFRQRGAIFEEAGLMLVQVSRDGLLVTGQNPSSTPRAVDEVIRALGRTPRPRKPDLTEATMLLIAELLRDEAARHKLDAAPAEYDARLIAMYGAMLTDDATDQADLRRGLLLLESAARHTTHPKVKSAIERAHLRLASHKRAHDPAEAAPPADRRRD